VHLLFRKGNTARILTWILGAVSVLAFVLVFAAPANAAIYDVARPVSEQYKEILTRNGLVILLTILLNIYGTLTLVGGAIYSAFLFWRKKILANRMYGNILIAAGALSPAVGGTFLRAGLADILYLSELIGAVLMFIGFTLSTSGKTEPPE
jgi:vacuolar-type H+-ATPase subunit I/STV1